MPKTAQRRTSSSTSACSSAASFMLSLVRAAARGVRAALVLHRGGRLVQAAAPRAAVGGAKDALVGAGPPSGPPAAAGPPAQGRTAGRGLGRTARTPA